ncbi:MAG TPA: Mur ligase family protein, partial [Anaerolineaceae bacterium]|nr:Mur ligase family protein [Anaerolineaceae bacterium]
MSAIARVLLECGYVVSGSDRSLSPLAADLRAAGVTVYEGHAAANIAGADIVVRSSAIPDDNVEVMAAREAGIPVLKRYDFLNQLTKDKKLVAVAGSHGKTTTSSMLAWAMTAQKMDPSYILGGVSRNLAANAHAGSGQYFVLEADEYDRMFLGLQPDCILLTNVEYDHPDCYPTVPEYHAAFRQFVGLLQPGGLLVTDIDQPASAEMLTALPAHASAVTFALSAPVDYRAVNLVVNANGGRSFDVLKKNITAPLVHVDLQVPGDHNVRNALGVLAVMDSLGCSIEEAAKALSAYKGSGRRFEIAGEVNGITIVNDYAHHPTKITATLSAARQRFPG